MLDTLCIYLYRSIQFLVAESPGLEPKLDQALRRTISKNVYLTNFREPRRGEVRRTPLLGTSVNKGKKEGRSRYAPALLAFT